ncbi:hypothetical protein LCGC14_2960920, partial [marine sediment metagenome]
RRQKEKVAPEGGLEKLPAAIAKEVERLPTAVEKAIRRQKEILKRKGILGSIERQRRKVGKKELERPAGKEGLSALERARQGRGELGKKEVVKPEPPKPKVPKEPVIVERLGLELTGERGGQSIIDRIRQGRLTPGLGGRILQNPEKFSPTELRFTAEHVLNNKRFSLVQRNRARNILKGLGVKEPKLVKSIDPKSSLGSKLLTQRLFTKAEFDVFTKGSQNKFVTKDAFDKALKSLNKKLNTLKTGIDPTALKEMATIGAFYIEAGMRSFAKWSNVMVRHFGDRIKPHLRSVFNESQRRLPRVTKKVKALEQKTVEKKAFKKSLEAPVVTTEQLIRDPSKFREVLRNPKIHDKETVAFARRLKSEGGFAQFTR